MTTISECKQVRRMNHDEGVALGRTGNTSEAFESTQESLWVDSSKQGDSLAFNRLVLKWEKTIYNMARRMLLDREEASDATQEIFLLAFRNIRSFRKDARFSTWLYRIALNHCISRVKRRPQGAHISLDHQHSAGIAERELQVAASQSGELLQAEKQKYVLASLSYLTPEQRAVVEMKFFEEMTFEDIALVLEIPVSTVKSRLYAALETLKIRMGSQKL
jgi:RNA polymerase sigma-70 factor (ECF subfamily)